MKDKLEELLKKLKGEEENINVKEQLQDIVNNKLDDVKSYVLLTNQCVCTYGPGKDMLSFIALLIHELIEEGAPREFVEEAIKTGLMSSEELDERAKDIKDKEEKMKKIEEKLSKLSELLEEDE